MFPTINHLDDLRPHIVDRPEIRINTNEHGYHIVCYTISDRNTFSDPDPVKTSFLRECRGITFYPDGKIASRSLHKFFNVGEREETQLHSLDLSITNVVRFMAKRDGSMLHPVLMPDGSLILKTKKSFTSDVALKATAFLHQAENKELLSTILHIMDANYTPIFEFTAPDNRIVLLYNKTELTLLHVRHNVTGEYMSKSDILNTERFYGVKTVEDHSLTTLQPLIDGIEAASGIEGYIFQFANGDMVKWKTPWYLALHRTCVFVRRRDIALMTINETLDDYKSFLSSTGSSATMCAVEEIEKTVLSNIMAIEADVILAFAQVTESMTRKDVATQFKSHKFFKLIMDLASGKEPKYTEFYVKHYLCDDFGLEQV